MEVRRMNSHLGVVDVTTTWTPKGLRPYQAIIDRGMAGAVMTAHVHNTRLDSRYPATLSKRTIENFERKAEIRQCRDIG